MIFIFIFGELVLGCSAVVVLLVLVASVLVVSNSVPYISAIFAPVWCVFSRRKKGKDVLNRGRSSK